MCHAVPVPKYSISGISLEPQSNPQPRTVTAYNGTPIRQFGIIHMPCQHKEQRTDTKFYIADTPGPVIFGLPLCIALGLVTINCAVNTNNTDGTPNKPLKTLADLKELYPDRFTGIGKFPGEHHIILDENVQPVIHPPRRAPVQLRDAIKAELDRMVSLEVIRPITEPTDWVSRITYVQKPNGQLRICLDPKDLNNALKRGQHHIPTLEELTHHFTGATMFSKLDAKSGYWSVPLKESSQLYTTFNTPFRRFCFKCLPFGLKTSQDVFQKAMDNILENLPGVVSIADDIVVYVKDQQEHDKNLQTHAACQGTRPGFQPREMSYSKARSSVLWKHLQPNRSETGSSQDPSYH